MVVLGWVEVRHYVGVQGEVGGGWRSGPTEGAVVLVLCPSGFCDGEMDQPGFSYHLSCRLQEEEGMSSGSRVGMEDVVDLLRNKVFGGLAAVTGTLFTLVSGLLGLGYGTVRFISNYVLRLYPMRMLDTSPCFSQVQFKVGVTLFLLLFLYQYFSTGAENIYLLCSSSLKAECIV